LLELVLDHLQERHRWHKRHALQRWNDGQTFAESNRFKWHRDSVLPTLAQN